MGTTYLARVRAFFYRFYRRIVSIINRYPLWTFFILLGILLLLIIAGNFLRKPKPEEKKISPVKPVRVYSIGQAPRIRVQAQVEKSGVITINALAGGVIQKLPFKEGEHVVKGQVLTYLSSNYFGGNAPAVQTKLAQTQYTNAQDTAQTQRELIAKQKEVAEKTDENSDELRKISAQSIDETKTLISLNDDILSTLDTNLKKLESTNSGGANDAMILSTKQLKSQFLSANNQLKSALRNTEYQTNENNPPAQLSNLQKDITIKQLELQEKSIALNLEISRLQLQLARINEGLMYPAAPFSATVQRVLVKQGQAVSPGTPLVILSQDIQDDPIIAIAYVSREIARKVSSLEPSTLYLGAISYTAYPSYITQDAIQGTLYGVYYPIPDNYHQFVTDKGSIEIEMPIGYYQTSSIVPYIPIDAVYQSQNESYVYVVVNNTAESRRIILGEVYGQYVQVVSGLKTGDRIIESRNVIAGDKVSIAP